jgi:translocation and assembly module TamA
MGESRDRLADAPRLALLLPLLVLGCAAHQDVPGPLVKSIRFRGNHAVSSSALADAIMTQRTGWWPFATRHGFDPVVWDRDLDRIVRFYEARGYYDAKVTKVHVDTAKAGEVRLEVEVQEGEPTHLSSLEVKGLDGLPEADREARVDRATRVATAKIEAHPGPLSSFGEIRIDSHGETAIRPQWIWDEVRQAIPEGRRFSDEDLAEARKRLVGMGVFGGVKVAAGAPDPATGRLPVLVETREAPFHTLRLGGGLRVDQIRNEGRFIAEWTNRNFLGGLRRLTAHAEAGWAVIPSLFAVQNQTGTVEERNGPVGRARLTFEQPRLFGRPPLRWTTSFDLDRTLEQTYDQAAGRFATGIAWRPRSSLTLGPSYHLEGEYLNGATPGTAFSAPLTLGCQTTGNSCFVWLSYVEAAITWDRRDDPLEPHKGFYLGLSVQQGGGPLGGTFDYTRVVPEARAFLSFADNAVTLAARARLGALYPSSGNPEDSAVDTRFYSGGAFSMRGFNERRLSPLLLTTTPATPSNPNPPTFTLPIGGNGLVDSSFEVRWRATTNLVIAAFVDIGQVTSDTLSVSDFAHLQYAVGIGARYLTPIGPIRVDFGRRLLLGQPVPLFVVNAAGQITQQSYAVNESCFGLGGSGVPTPVPDGLCAIHVSIGEAF